MIRKSCALLMVASLMALPAIAQAGKSRTATGTYNTIMITPQDGSPSTEGRYSNGVWFKVRPGEKFVSVSLEDESGYPVRAVVVQDLNDDGDYERSVEICSATKSPIRIADGGKVGVWAQEGQCEDGTAAIGTFGTITATFTR